ncbi:MAG: hypothetical protein AB1779_10230, partial [Candidatus Thermoplasmatota archaeon]
RLKLNRKVLVLKAVERENPTYGIIEGAVETVLHSNCATALLNFQNCSFFAILVGVLCYRCK